MRLRTLNLLFINKSLKGFFILLFFAEGAFAQICPAIGPPSGALYGCEDVFGGTSRFEMSTPDQLEVVFDDISDYAGAVVLTGATKLAVKAVQNALEPTACKWELQMIVDNDFMSLPAPANDEWNQEVLYGLGTSGPAPKIYELELRIYNQCGTPITTAYQQFSLNNDVLVVIDGSVLVPMDPAGTCNSGVNGAGSYLLNMSEYSFYVDYTIKLDASTLFGGVPNPFAYNPGRYRLKVHFCLREIP